MAAQVVTEFLVKLQDQVSDALESAESSAQNLGSTLKQLREEQGKGGSADKKRRSSLKQLATGFKVAAAAATAMGAAFATLGGFAIKTNSDLEKFETQLGQLLGGLDKGEARVRKLFEISARTPFSISGLVEADAKLEAFGVNADRVRGGVMDLAGAMGMDVTEAANAVGKALSGGAGAADVLREKGVLAMVEMDAGMAVANMTAEQFRTSLVKTLETNAKIVGGTEKLANTFSGMMSTLRDQFTIFSKEVGDADLFSTAKASLRVLLDLLNANSKQVSEFARSVGSSLSSALVGAVDIAFKFAALTQRIREGFLTIVQVVKVLAIGLAEMVLSAMQNLTKIPLIGDQIAETIGGGMAFVEAEIGRMNRELAKTTGGIDQARENQTKLKEMGEQTVTAIRNLANEYQRAADASKDIETPEGSEEIMTMVGVDPKAAKEAEATASKTAKLVQQLNRLGKSFRRQAQSVGKPLKESEKMQNTLQDMADKLAAAKAKAAALGPSGVAAFEQVEGGMIASMNAIAAAIPKQQRQETLAAVGNVANQAVGAMQDGGMGLLSSMGPGGAAAAGLIGIGQAGEGEIQAAAQEAAQEAAEERQAQMEDERSKMEAKGYSEAEIDAAGLSTEDIAAAGQVTEEDVAEAREGLDEDQIMADMMAQGVQDVIDGIINIAHALPEILQELIPMLLTELPQTLIEMIPVLIEELIPVLLEELPKTLFNILFKTFPKLVKMLLLDLPRAIIMGVGKWWGKVWGQITKFFKSVLSFGIFQTGGYVPKTQMALLHQGERVIPATGAGSQTATRGLAAFSTGAGPSLTVNTNVVSPDTIPELGRLIDSSLGAFGRETNPLFGESSAVTSL